MAKEKCIETLIIEMIQKFDLVVSAISLMKSKILVCKVTSKERVGFVTCSEEETLEGSDVKLS